MTSDEIRKYAREKYVEPAIAKGEREVRVRAGDVHKAMALKNRVPVVCQALESKLFLKENNLVLESKEGPPSGLSTSVVFTYRIEKEEPSRAAVSQPSALGKYKNPALLELLKLRGIGKELFASLGGGEEFLRTEREALNESLLKREREHGV
jgi:hypothetical protein